MQRLRKCGKAKTEKGKVSLKSPSLELHKCPGAAAVLEINGVECKKRNMRMEHI